MACLARGIQLSLHHHLGRNAGVVRAGLPQRLIAFHPMVSNERIHDRILKGMAHVQAARHIRWRNCDAKSRAFATRGKRAIAFPRLVKRLLDGVWVVCFARVLFSHCR